MNFIVTWLWIITYLAPLGYASTSPQTVSFPVVQLVSPRNHMGKTTTLLRIFGAFISILNLKFAGPMSILRSGEGAKVEERILQ